MKLPFRFSLPCALAATLLVSLPCPAQGIETINNISFKELYSLIESNLVGMPPQELEKAAVRGLLKELEGKVSLLAAVTNAPSTNAPGLLSTNVFDNTYAYVRLGRLEDGTAGTFSNALQSLRATNDIKGLVMDLRFSDGTNYPAAMAVADLFVKKETPLLQIEEATISSTAKSISLSLPAVVLVNRRTAAAAEALAAVLRHQNAALIIGGRTAGQALIYRDLALSDGQHVRMASRYIRVAEGMQLPTRGLKPDIEVEVPEASEWRYLENPYAQLNSVPELGLADALGFSRSTVNEAELVRRHREGLNPDADPATTPASEPRPAAKTVRDPVLNRALDLLKGLAVVKKLE